MKSRAATRPGSVAGSSGTTTGPGTVRPEGSHGLCWSAGSVDATHVSLLVPSPRLEITSESAPAPTRVSPPGRSRKRRASDPSAASSATAKVRSTTGRGTRAPSSPTVGIVDGARISCPTQSVGRARTRSARRGALGRRQQAGPQGTPAGRRLDGEQQQIVEVGEYVAEAVGPSAPPALGAAQGELLAEQGGGHVAEQPVEGRVLEDPGAERIEDGHPPAPDDLEQSGYTEQRVGPQFHGIAPHVVHPADHRIDRIEPGQRPEPDPVVLDHQVPTLDEGVAEVGGQVGVLEVGLREWARGEDDDPWLVHVLGHRPGDSGPDGPEEAGLALDAGRPVQSREHPGQRRPVDQRVAQPRGRLGPVGHRPEAVGLAHDVDGGQEQPVGVGADAVGARSEEGGMAEDDLGRHHAPGHEGPLAVQVGVHEVEQGGPLHDGSLEGLPVPGVEDQGYRVEGPRPTVASSVDPGVVGGALVAQQPGQLVPA